MTAPIPVVVTAIGGGGNGEQIVKALRIAGGYHIVGMPAPADIQPLSD